MTATDRPDPLTRRVNTVTRDGEEVRVLVLRRTVAAPAGEVWAALTDADRLARWLGLVSGELAVGGTFSLEDGATGEVLDCVEPERLSLTWRRDEQAGWVDVSLRPVGGGTLLQLDHTAPHSEQRWAEVGPAGAGVGWEAALDRLEAHLGSPDSPGASSQPRAGAPAYDAWAEAAIADGDDPEQARAAAARALEGTEG